MLGFSFSLLCRAGSDTEATTGWTDKKPWEIAWGELRWEERDGSVDTVDGWETVGNSLGDLRWRVREGNVDTVDGWETMGNSLERAPLGESEANRLGRAPLGGSKMEAWTRWTDGKPWEIAWGGLRWE